MKHRRREYNRKIRHQKLSEDSCSRGYNKMFRCLTGIRYVDDYINYERKKLKEYFGYDVDCEIKVEDYTFMLSLDFAKKR